LNGLPNGRDVSSILAREEAGRFRHDFVGTEHVLLGLIRDGEGMATAVLQRLGRASRP
jgi:ATP-dependent Clp protease ATP-binding subunit ClpC